MPWLPDVTFVCNHVVIICGDKTRAVD